MKQKDGSFAIIFHNDSILLFHRDNNPDIPHPNCWQLPGGGIEDGETPLQGMNRELIEEVSYIPKKLVYLGEIQRETYKVYLYGAFVSDKESTLFKKGEGEGQEIDFVPLDSLLDLQLTPRLKNLFTLARNELEYCVKKKNLKPLYLKYKNQ